MVAVLGDMPMSVGLPYMVAVLGDMPMSVGRPYMVAVVYYEKTGGLKARPYDIRTA